MEWLKKAFDDIKIHLFIYLFFQIISNIALIGVFPLLVGIFQIGVLLLIIPAILGLIALVILIFMGYKLSYLDNLKFIVIFYIIYVISKIADRLVYVMIKPEVNHFKNFHLILIDMFAIFSFIFIAFIGKVFASTKKNKKIKKKK